jgi:hypothetical protein
MMLSSRNDPFRIREAIENRGGLFVDDSSGDGAHALGWLLLGTALGAGATYLLASRAGEGLRAEIRHRVRALIDRNEQFAEKVRDEGGLPGPVKHVAP